MIRSSGVSGAAALLLLVLSSGAEGQGAPALPRSACTVASTARGVEAFIALPAGSAPSAQGTVTALVCLARPASSPKVGSYTGELRFDSTAVQVVAVEQGSGGMRIGNATQPGRLLFAGAEPMGFGSDTVLRVVLRVARSAAALPPLALMIREVSSAAGENLSARLSVHGYRPASSPSSRAPAGAF